MKKFLLVILFLGTVIMGGSPSEAASNNAQRTGTLFIEKDFMTGQITEGTYQTNNIQSSEETEKFIEIEKLEDMIPHISEAVKKYEGTLQFKYNVVGEKDFDSLEHNEDIKKVWGEYFKEGSYASGTVKKMVFITRYAAGPVTKVELKLSIDYTQTMEQEVRMTEIIQQVATEISKTAKTDLDKVLAVNEYITRNSSYSNKTKASPHSPHTILTEKQGVCQAYALVAQRLLQELDVKAYYQTGTIKDGELHAWNIVNVDNRWYNLDTTWNDPLTDRKGQTTYEYLLVSDEIIQQTRSIDPFGLPKAVSKKYDVLRTFSPYTTYGAFDEENIYVSEWEQDKGYVIKAYNKKTMKVVKNLEFTVGLQLISHNGLVYHFGPYSQTNLYVWSNADKSIELLAEGAFNELYIKDDKLYYRDAKTNKLHKIDITERVEPVEPVNPVDPSEPTEPTDEPVTEPKDESVQIEELENAIAELDEFSKDFEKALASVDKKFDLLSADSQLLVKNSKRLTDMKKLLQQKDQLMITYDTYKKWNKLNPTDDPLKKWTITFNKPVGSLKGSPISIVDSYGRAVKGMTMTIAGEEGNQVVLTPKDPYEIGHTYYIVIKDKLTNTEEVKLKRGVLASFIVNE